MAYITFLLFPIIIVLTFIAILFLRYNIAIKVYNKNYISRKVITIYNLRIKGLLYLMCTSTSC